MKAVIRRIDRLEERFEPEPEEEPPLVVITRLDRKLALENSICFQILRECGLFRGGAACVVKLSDIPGGLNAVELRTFLREHGPKIVRVSG
jgi:hypothetical protein